MKSALIPNKRPIRSWSRPAWLRYSRPPSVTGTSSARRMAVPEHGIHSTRMRTFADRFIGAARLTPAIYEEVEADKTATGQAMLVVALASVAAGIVPGLGPLILLAVSVWMLVAMVIAVRQALDFTSTGRTLMVCAAGWVVMLIMIGLLGGFLGPVAQ